MRCGLVSSFRVVEQQRTYSENPLANTASSPISVMWMLGYMNMCIGVRVYMYKREVYQVSHYVVDSAGVSNRMG